MKIRLFVTGGTFDKEYNELTGELFFKDTHLPEILKAAYEVMGYSEEEIQERIGHMLTAFGFGVPPHGGIALGVERLIMNLTGETHLREVQAFPMTRGGQTSVMKAPKDLTAAQLAELGIQITKKTK